MKSLTFTKMQASGNDFVVIENSPQSTVHGPQILAKKICDRKYGVGADGVLLLEKSTKADVRMRIFNADGTEAEMCGNGARCCALFVSKRKKKNNLSIETKAGLLEAQIKGEDVKLKMTDPLDLKLDMRIHVGGKEYEVDYLNTGVPHAVIEVDDIEHIPVKKIGRLIRHHDVFKPAGTNVDFIKMEEKDRILVRTYERGVEDETLACGTGSVAAAIITTLNHARRSGSAAHKVYCQTQSGEVLSVYFRLLRKKIIDVWLEGKASVVFEGKLPLA